MNKIKEVYANVTADESVVGAAIEKAKQQKITRFSAGRIAAIAASFVVVTLAVGITVFILGQRMENTARMVADEVYEAADAGKTGGAENEAGESPDDAAAGASGSFSKSADAGLRYHSDTIPALGATDILCGTDSLTVTYHISDSKSYDPEEVCLSVFDSSGSEALKLDAEVTPDPDGGINITARFSPAEGDTLTLRYYESGTLIKEETITLTEE